MNKRFGQAHGTMGRSSDRDRKLFIAAAILALSLVLVLAVVFKLKIADGSVDKVPEVTNPEESSASLARVELLSPDRPVRAGTLLSVVKFKKIFWPRQQVPEGAIKDLVELKGKYAKIDLAEGAPILSGQITAEIAKETLPLTPGHRAITIDINAEMRYTLPGTIVDVVLTHYIGRELNTKVLVEKARVLSLGGSTDVNPGVGGGGRRKASKTVTLDVLPKDALRIIGSKRLGSLTLILRDAGDFEANEVSEVNTQDIIDVKEQKKIKKRCTKGRVKIDGNEFIVQCDGRLFPAGDGLEP